jgi:hypothetical protein
MRVQLSEYKVNDEFGRSGAVNEVKTDISQFFKFQRYVTAADNDALEPPKDLPENIRRSFEEGARCLANGCPNAAAGMFRLCLDLATKTMLPQPEAEDGPTKHERRNLAPRLRWLFDHKLLPDDLRELSSAVKEDGDDGAHDGSLTAHDAEDIYDFAFALLDRIYSEPARIAAAAERRLARRASIEAARAK